MVVLSNFSFIEGQVVGGGGLWGLLHIKTTYYEG